MTDLELMKNLIESRTRETELLKAHTKIIDILISYRPQIPVECLQRIVDVEIEISEYMHMEIDFAK